MQENMYNDINICDYQKIITPLELKKNFPLLKKNHNIIINHQRIISNIICGKDPRLLVICGPCSIHDRESTIDYANRLKVLFDELNDRLYIMMRVYLEKPRTIFGWKGLINDPYMDGSCDIEYGLKLSRSLLLDLVSIGLPLAGETLCLFTPHYLGELFSWSSIGARTIESQVHREIASMLPMPIGFKNSTDGGLISAINAIRSASIAHSFTGIDLNGRICLLRSRGNLNCHIILRGGTNKPNYYPKDIAYCESQLLKNSLPLFILVDCSHGNSGKNYHHQVKVVKSVLNQIKSGNRSIFGLMLESNINFGSQILESSGSKLRYGVSITDSCIDWITTEELLRQVYAELRSLDKNSFYRKDDS